MRHFAAFLLFFAFLCFQFSGILTTSYVWIGGDSCYQTWSEETDASCWSPAGYPSVNDSVIIKSNLTITCTTSACNKNGFAPKYYAYGEVNSIQVNSFQIQYGGTVHITSQMSFIFQETSYLYGSLLISGYLASIDGAGDLYVDGVLTLAGGIIEGEGELIILSQRYLLLDYIPESENYLLRDTIVEGKLLQTGRETVTHTGFWWQSGQTVVTVYGEFSLLEGFFYDWEEEGVLIIETGGFLPLNRIQMRGIDIINYGELILENSIYSTEFTLTLYTHISNFEIISTSPNGNIELSNIVFTEGGTFYANSEISIMTQYVDNHGFFYAESDVGFASGVVNSDYRAMYSYPNNENPSFWEGVYSSFNGTILYGTGAIFFYVPILVQPDGLVISTNVSFAMEVPSGFYPMVNYPLGNITVTESGVVYLDQTSFQISPQTIDDELLFIVHGSVFVNSGSQTNSSLSFVILNSGVLNIEKNATLRLERNASIYNCGGSVIVDGTLHGSSSFSCPFSFPQLQDWNQKHISILQSQNENTVKHKLIERSNLTKNLITN